MTGRSEDLWVGIDVGTQSVRVLVVSGSGERHGHGSASLSSVRDGARHEQDPALWWEAIGVAARQAMQPVDPAGIRGLALDATSGTVLLVDADGTALTPGVMYDDTRAGAEADRATAVGRDLWRRLGYQRMQPSWALPKLLWLLDNVTTAPGDRLAHQGDYLTGRLVGGPVACDLSTVLKSGCDLVAEAWPASILAALGVPETMLPPLVRPGAPVGTIGASAAAHTGLPTGVPVFAGMTDGCAAQLGAGVIAAGDWNCVVGTTLVLKGVSDHIVVDPSGALYCHRAPDGGWLPGGASSSGAGAIARALPDRDLDALAAQAHRYEPSEVLTYPLASGRGERFPFVAATAEPFQLGHPRDDVEAYAALIQGVAFVERLCFDHLDRLGAPTEGRRVLTGGATRSRYWSQLRADVMRRPVTLTEQAEAAVGMAVLAASHEYGLRDAATEMVRVTDVIEPRPDVGHRLGEAYVRFVDELDRRHWIEPDLADRARKAAA